MRAPAGPSSAFFIHRRACMLFLPPLAPTPELRIVRSVPCAAVARFTSSPTTGRVYGLADLGRPTLYRYSAELGASIVGHFDKARLLGTDFEGRPVLETERETRTVGDDGATEPSAEGTLPEELFDGASILRLAPRELAIRWPVRPSPSFEDGHRVRRLTLPAGSWGAVSLSPDGETIAAVAARGADRIGVARRDDPDGRVRWVSCHVPGFPNERAAGPFDLALLDAHTAVADFVVRDASPPDARREVVGDDGTMRTFWIGLVSLTDGEVRLLKKVSTDAYGLWLGATGRHGEFAVSNGASVAFYKLAL